MSAAVSGNLLAELSYDDEPMAQKLRKASRLIAGLLLPPSIFLAVFGRWVLGIFGPTYAAQSYGISSDFRCRGRTRRSDQRLCHLLRIKGEPHKAAAMNLAMAAVALGGAWFLTGSFGVAGAAWAWALSQAVGCVFVAVDALVGEENQPPPQYQLERTAEDRGPFVERRSMRRHHAACDG